MMGRPGYSRWLGGELTFGLAPISRQPYCLQRPRGKRSRGQEQVARPVPALERRSVGVISFLAPGGQSSPPRANPSPRPRRVAIVAVPKNDVQRQRQARTKKGLSQDQP